MKSTEVPKLVCSIIEFILNSAFSENPLNKPTPTPEVDKFKTVILTAIESFRTVYEIEGDMSFDDVEKACKEVTVNIMKEKLGIDFIKYTEDVQALTNKTFEDARKQKEDKLKEALNKLDEQIETCKEAINHPRATQELIDECKATIERIENLKDMLITTDEIDPKIAEELSIKIDNLKKQE